MSGSYYLTCRLGQEWYGISIDHVLEVLHLVALNDSPTASSLGVITLRDKVMPVIDLRQYFNLPEPNYLLETLIITISQDDRQPGFVVDEANEVVLIQAESIPYDEAVIQGVVRHDSCILFLLDIPGFSEMYSHRRLLNYIQKQNSDCQHNTFTMLFLPTSLACQYDNYLAGCFSRIKSQRLTGLYSADRLFLCWLL